VVEQKIIGGLMDAAEEQVGGCGLSGVEGIDTRVAKVAAVLCFNRA